MQAQSELSLSWYARRLETRSWTEVGTEPEDPPPLAAGLPGSISVPRHTEGPRGATVAAAIESFRAGAERDSFRLVAFSIQDDHVHAIVEAENAATLGRGMRSLGA